MRKFRSSLLKVALAVAVAVPYAPSFLTDNGSVFAETAKDPAPFINAKVVNENAGQKVLFDNTHGQTSGAADWVIDGGFSDFGNALANDGFYVKELRKTTPVTYDDLKDYDVFVIPEANVPYKTSEQDAMLQYVKDGGSIFFIADHYNADRNKNRWDASEVMNGYRRGAWEDPAKGMTAEEASSAAMQGVESSDWLGDNFGIRFRYNALADITANNIVSPEQSFGITEGVDTVAMHAGSTLAVLDPMKAKGIVYLPETDEAWPNAVDQGVYEGGGVAEGPFAAISKLGLGKAAFIGDSSPVEDATPKYLREETGKSKTTYDGFKEQDDAILLVNIVNWLADDESYTSFDEVPGLQLDQSTTLLDIENPQTSTEPQAEPWSAPAAGYQWWNPETFKAGSFGSTEVVNNPTFTLVHQSVLPNAEEFQIRVDANNMTPGSTLGGYNVGIYLPGGKQVAQVQNPDGTWPTAYGYSTQFSLTANQLGHASKMLTVRVMPGTEGSANLRFRQGSSAIKTEPVTIGNVPAEQLPEEDQGLPEQISIAEARTQTGEIVTVEGTVTTQPGMFGAKGFYLQDDTAGIYVYTSSASYNVGDKVKVTASVEEYNTELELTNPVKMEKTGTSELPDPQVVNALSQENQGELVTLENVTIANLHSVDKYGTFEFDAVKGDQSTLVRVDNRSGLSFDQFPYKDGQLVNITGISSIFKGTFQLKPRGLDDFIVDTTVPTVTLKQSGEEVHDVSLNDTVVFTVEATDDMSGVKEVTLTVDGAAIVSGKEYKASYFGLGQHTVKATATDFAGNTVELVKLFAVLTDLPSLAADVDQAYDNGAFANYGTYRSIKATLDSVQSMVDKGKFPQAELQLAVAKDKIAQSADANHLDKETAASLSNQITYLLNVGLE